MSAALRLFDPDDDGPDSVKHRAKQRLPDFLRWPDAMRLLDWCTAQIAICTDNIYKDDHYRSRGQAKVDAARRDEIVVRVGLYLGLRVTEIINLNVTDIDLVNRSAFVFQGKGSKDRYVRIPEKLVPHLANWIGDRTDGVLIKGINGRRCAGRTIHHRLDVAAKKAGIAVHVHPHTLRHTYATHFLESGGNIRNLQALLGHSRLETTSAYLDVDVTRFAEDVDRL